MGGASSATSELSCSNSSSDTAPLPRAFTGLTQRNRPITSCGVLRSRLRSKESLSRHTFRSTSLARQALLSMSTAPSGSPPAWLRAPGLWWCKHREGRCGSRGRRRWPASNPASKQRAPRRSIPAKRTLRRATASAHPDGALHRPGQSPRRPRPVQQPRRRLWLSKEPQRASNCRRTRRCRRSLRLHNPSPNRIAPNWRPPLCRVLTDRERAPSARR